MVFFFGRRRKRQQDGDGVSTEVSETHLPSQLGTWFMRAGLAVCVWAAASIFNFSLDAFNNTLSRARFNREMEKVKKGIELTVNKHFSVIVSSKGESAAWLNRLLSELWGTVVIPVLDAQVPSLLNQAFQDALKPPDGSPSQLPKFIKDLKLEKFKLGNSPPRVESIKVPEVKTIWCTYSKVIYTYHAYYYYGFWKKELLY